MLIALFSEMTTALYFVLLVGCAWGQQGRTLGTILPALFDYSCDIQKAVSKAAAYLVDNRKSDYGWSSSISTSRAVVALSFAEKIVPRDEYEKTLMKQQLDIQLSLDLMAGREMTSLSHLALYINALHATCKTPHNSQGMDLVGILRSRTDEELIAMNSNFSLPAVLLTLCTAEKNIDSDIQALQKMYHNLRNDRIGSLALVLMAMVCNIRKGVNFDYEPYVEYFFSRIVRLEASNTDVYTKALIIQTFNSLRNSEKIGNSFNLAQRVKELLDQQLENGSFGDLLSTYYAIPALLNTSLLDLKCKYANSDEGMLRDAFSNLRSKAKKVTYTLWMDSDTTGSTYSTAITFWGNNTFHDVMKMAEARNPMFRFLTDYTVDGRKVYSLAGIPNDAETGMLWTLYRKKSDGRKLEEIEVGVDRIFPNEKDLYIFKLKRNMIRRGANIDL